MVAEPRNEYQVGKNEAEFQSKLRELISKKFCVPKAEINLERHLKLHFGHHEVLVNGCKPKRSAMLGRYDLQVSIKGRPVMIAELKAPGVHIDTSACLQALSYAKLQNPSVPLVLVTNGEETVLLTTYNGERINQQISGSFDLQTLLEGCSRIAAADVEGAVRLLLGSDDEVWRTIFSEWNKQEFIEMTGSICHFQYSLVDGFAIPREVPNEVEKEIEESDKIIILSGAPMSGVSNSLVQLCSKESNNPILYVNTRKHPDALQYIANRMSREQGYPISKDDVRGWFNTTSQHSTIILLLDGIPEGRVEELISQAIAGSYRLVIGTDYETLNRLRVDRGRSDAYNTRSFKEFHVGTLSDNELQNALSIVARLYGIVFWKGVEYTSEYREPRILRAVLANAIGEDAPSIEGVARGMCIRLAPFPVLDSITSYSSIYLAEPEMKYAMTCIARAYLGEELNSEKRADLIQSTWGKVSVDPELALSLIDSTCIDKLVQYGILSWIDVKSGGQRILIRVNEYLAEAIAVVWSEEIIEADQTDSMEAKLEKMLSISSFTPMGDISLASSLMKSGVRDLSLLLNAISALLGSKPVVKQLSSGSELVLLGTDGCISVKYNDTEGSEYLYGNIQPWVVLSHLLCSAMVTNESEDSVNIRLFMEIGNSRALLMRTNFYKLANVPPFAFHDVPGYGSILCGSTGIVEPLQYAMMLHLLRFPDEMIRLAQEATDNDLLWLICRLETAARACITSTSKKASEAAETIQGILHPWWHTKLFKRCE